MEIIEYLNDSRCALMPTRADAQGVMACEMATFGIPLITSDIDICREIFRDFGNVGFINNNDKSADVLGLLSLLEKSRGEKNQRFFASNTVGEEVKLFLTLVGMEHHG